MPNDFNWDQFERVDEKKEEFNWDDYEPDPRANPSQGESIARGGFQGLSMGFEDELGGGLEALGSLFGYRGVGGNFSDIRPETEEEKAQSFGEAYTQARDMRRDRNRIAQEVNPKSYMAGEVGGGVATSLTPAGMGKLAASGVKGAVTVGAAQGGAYGLGASEADSVGDMALDAAKGAAIGGGTAGLVSGITKGVGKFAQSRLPKAEQARGVFEPDINFEMVDDLASYADETLVPRGTQGIRVTAKDPNFVPRPQVPDEIIPEKSSGELVREWIEQGRASKADKIKDFAERKAAKAAIGNQAKYMDPLIRDKKINKFGRDLLDSDVIKPFSKAENIAGLTEEASDNVGRAIGDLIGSVDDNAAGMVNGRDIADKIADYAASIESPNNTAMVENLLKQAEAFESMGEITLKEAQRLKNQYRFSMSDPSTMALGKQSTNKVNRIVSDSMEQALPEDQLLKYKDLKSKYGTLQTAEEASEKLASRESKNRMFSLTDYIAGGAGYGVTGPAGVGLAVGNKVLRERGNSTLAFGADKLSKYLSSNPSAFGKFAGTLTNAAQKGPQALGASHYILWKNDPEYRRTLEGMAANVLDN